MQSLRTLGAAYSCLRHVHRRRGAWSIALPSMLLSQLALAEPFIGQFELKTLASEPGSIELQSQNAWAWDQPARRVADVGGDELWFDENAAFRERYALEVELGFTQRLKVRVGIEAENERIEDADSPDDAEEFGGLEVSEIGAEIVAILLPREDHGFGLGLVAEIEGPFEQDEPNHLTLGGIFEFQSGTWLFAAVPMVVRAFGGDTEPGESRDEKWDFAYAAQVQRALSDQWALALEGYGTVERISGSGRASEAATYFGDSDQHRLGPVLYFASEWDAGEDAKELSLGLGLFQGLNSHTADHTLKLSIELDF